MSLGSRQTKVCGGKIAWRRAGGKKVFLDRSNPDNPVFLKVDEARTKKIRTKS